MQTPLQIAWEGLEPSDFVKARIEREVAALERTFGRITSCKVHVAGRTHRRHKGGLYAVRAHLVLPGGVEIDASRNPPQDHAHEDAYVAIRDVFDALRRQLRERVSERREEAKRPVAQPHGLVCRLAPDKDHGFIRADDGREIYFHRNSVLTGFDCLRIGSEVRFDEEEGREGPQASSVHAFGVGKRAD
jgi:cold shock CspA family protein/ribosome-associated translation inhibitor RaiA